MQNGSPCSDKAVWCLQRRYSEPLFGALNRTKDLTFVKERANQLYRLSGFNAGQIAAQRNTRSPTYRIVAVQPGGDGKWAARGRLRVLLSPAPGPGGNVTATVQLNGVELKRTSNISSMYADFGPQFFTVGAHIFCYVR